MPNAISRFYVRQVTHYDVCDRQFPDATPLRFASCEDAIRKATDLSKAVATPDAPSPLWRVWRTVRPMSFGESVTFEVYRTDTNEFLPEQWATFAAAQAVADGRNVAHAAAERANAPEPTAPRPDAYQVRQSIGEGLPYFEVYNVDTNAVVSTGHLFRDAAQAYADGYNAAMAGAPWTTEGRR